MLSMHLQRWTWFALACTLAAYSLAAPAHAANHYVRAGASGNGSSWTNAYGSLPSTLIRGDTYFVADGSYSGYTFNDGNSGTTVITIKKAIEANHGTDSGWSSAYGDGQALFTGQLGFTTGYYTIDGQTRNADWAGGYGFKIDATGGKGINIGSSSTTADNVTVRYVEIAGRGRDGAGSPANDLIYVLPAVTGLKVQYCYLHDAGRTAWLLRSADDGLIEYCLVARNESTSGQHSEAISAVGTDRWTIRYNVWEDIEGTGIIIFVGDRWDIYGNVFLETGTPPYGGLGGNGAVGTWTGEAVTNSRVHNNTFIACTGLNQGVGFDGAYASGNTVYNNIWYACEKAGIGGAAGDYNMWLDTPVRYGTTPQANDVVDAAAADPFIDWVGGDFGLKAATPAGMALPAPFNVDMLGAIRGGDGTWDRGAIEYAGVPAVVADAGPDRTVTDTDGDGFAIVTLDGSASYANAGTITGYLWREDQTPLGFECVSITVLTVGTHTVALEVTGSSGAKDTDTAMITVEPPTDGDCDGDGDVDLDDFVILKKNFGRTDATRADGDFTGEGRVDLEDFVILKQNFGT